MRLLSTLFLCSSLFFTGCNVGKIGVVDLNQVMTQSIHAQKAQKEALEVQKIYQYNLNVIEKKLATYKDKKLAENYLKQAAVQLQQQLQVSQAGINQAMANTLSEVIQEKTKDYSLVMNKTTVWVNGKESLDITSDILTEFNNATVTFPARPQKVDNPNLPKEK